MKKEAVIFDMDGVMVDSEPSWRQAEIEIFQTVGLSLTEDDCLKTLGYRIDEVAHYWFAIQPWQGESTHAVANRIVDRVIELVNERGKAMRGLNEAIHTCKDAGLKLAVASSSPFRLIEATLEKLNVRDNFDVICSAESEAYGKPHPAVFITTAGKLKVDPAACLVIEDSPNGVIAARAAKMDVVAVPEPHNFNRPEFGIARKVLKSLLEFEIYD